MPDIHYTLYGCVNAPEGSKLNETGTGIVLPDGRTLKVWEAFEIFATPDADPENISFDELAEIGVHYDGDMARFEMEDD